MHGGVKVYRGSAAAARTYVEADRTRADDYYLAEGTGVAERYVAVAAAPGAVAPVVLAGGTLDGDAYEAWVAGLDATGTPKGRIRNDDKAVRFVEVVVNGPKTWSLAAAVHPEIATAYEAAQDRAAGEIITWVAANTTTRLGPRGRQVQVPVEQLEAAVIRHHTSRAGDPHRHLHLQMNARVFAVGKWRGIHTVGVRDSLGAINGIGHAAVLCDPEFRAAVESHGYSFNSVTGEISELAPFVSRFSERTAQIERNVARLEAKWRRENPGREPGPSLRRSWDSRAWAQARPDKVVPTDGAAMARGWREELHDLGFRPPPLPRSVTGAMAQPNATPWARTVAAVCGRSEGRLARDDALKDADGDRIVEAVLVRLGGRRSSWNAADIRGEVELAIAAAGVVAEPTVRIRLAEDLTTRAVADSVALLDRDDVPGHVRALTSRRVLAAEEDLTTRFAARGNHRAVPSSLALRGPSLSPSLDQAQRAAVEAIATDAALVVIEGAAGAGKTTTLSAARAALESQGQRFMVVSPTLKAAEVASRELGTPASSAARLVYDYGFRWDQDGRWSRYNDTVGAPPQTTASDLAPGDVMLVDEAGMLDQDTARALTRVADETGARLVLMGDRHQLPAVGRGGVLDLAKRWAAPEAVVTLDSVHRFTDPDYAALSLLMRTGERSAEVFDQLLTRGQIRIYPTDVERTEALTTGLTTALTTALTTVDSAPSTPDGTPGGMPGGTSGGTPELDRSNRPSEQPESLLVAKTNSEVDLLNKMIRDQRVSAGDVDETRSVVGASGGRIAAGDTVATRHNDHALGVANRDTWTVTAVAPDGSVTLAGRAARRGHLRTVPPDYARHHLSLAYATTAHGAQGDTVAAAHLSLSEHTDAACAYVAMTRGREANTAHLVADSIEDARRQWVDTFNRDRADLGPGHAAGVAADEIERYGPAAPTPPSSELTAQELLALTRAARKMTGAIEDEGYSGTPGSGQRRPPPSPGGWPRSGGRGPGR